MFTYISNFPFTKLIAYFPCLQVFCFVLSYYFLNVYWATPYVILRFYFSLYYFNSFLCYFNSFLYWSTPVHVLTIRGVNFLNCKFDYFTPKFQITFLSKDIYSDTCIKISCFFVVVLFCFLVVLIIWASLVVRNLPANVEDVVLIPGLRKNPLEKKMVSPLQNSSCMGNPMDRKAWWTTVNGVSKESDTT